MSSRIGLFGLLVLLSGAIQAQDVPLLIDRVSDYANILSDSEEKKLIVKLKHYEKNTTNQIAVLTINSLEGHDIEPYSIEVAETWGIGQEYNDNGVLLVFAIKERKIRIEVGRGLEGDITDARSNRIIRDYLTPYFKKGDYYTGIDQAINQLINAASGFEHLDRPLETYGVPQWAVILMWILGVSGVIIAILLYRNWCRNRPRVSKKTGMPMTKLDEKADDEHLTSGQRTEEQIGNIDYDVWVTDEGDDLQVIAYKKWSSKYRKCPSCKYHAYYTVYRHTIASPTYVSSGKGERKDACMHCKHAHIYYYHIAKLVDIGSSDGSSRGGGFSGGGGSFGGGGASGSW